MRMLVVIWLGTAAAWTSVPRLASSRAAVATSHSRPSMLLEEAQGTEALLRLCAATDRGQRCTSAERAIIASLVRDMEGDAPRADATMLNGNWRLLYASTPSVYRSSPFFWAFKQAALTLTLALLLAMTLALISTLALTLTLALALALALTLPRRWPARRPLSPSRAAACSRAMRWRR